MTPEYTEVQRLLDAVGAASSARHAAPTHAARQAVRAAQHELNAARAAMRASFAAEQAYRPRRPKNVPAMLVSLPAAADGSTGHRFGKIRSRSSTALEHDAVLLDEP